MKGLRRFVFGLWVVMLLAVRFTAACAQDDEDFEFEDFDAAEFESYTFDATGDGSDGSEVSGDETDLSDVSDAENILKKFPISRYTYRFLQRTKHEYFRFPVQVPSFDPLDLKYFPHETWNETEWGLLAHYEDSYTFKQLMMLRDPVETWTFQGKSIGHEYGFLDDFYLYATLFVSDSSPDDAGSCYIYYSDSLTKGFGMSAGIMVDPESGVFLVDNIYDIPYALTNKNHDMNMLVAFDRGEFPIDENNIGASSYAAHDLKYDLMDEQFEQDWDSVKALYHIPGTTVRAYRVELIREGTNLRVYINGKPAAELDDGITTSDENWVAHPSKVSWSYGPLLHDGGETVTCSIGALYIYEHERDES